MSRLPPGPPRRTWGGLPIYGPLRMDMIGCLSILGVAPGGTRIDGVFGQTLGDLATRVWRTGQTGDLEAGQQELGGLGSWARSHPRAIAGNAPRDDFEIWGGVPFVQSSPVIEKLDLGRSTQWTLHHGRHTKAYTAYYVMNQAVLAVAAVC